MRLCVQRSSFFFSTFFFPLSFCSLCHPFFIIRYFFFVSWPRESLGVWQNEKTGLGVHLKHHCLHFSNLISVNTCECFGSGALCYFLIFMLQTNRNSNAPDPKHSQVLREIKFEKCKRWFFKWALAPFSHSRSHILEFRFYWFLIFFFSLFCLCVYVSNGLPSFSLPFFSSFFPVSLLPTFIIRYFFFCFLTTWIIGSMREWEKLKGRSGSTFLYLSCGAEGLMGKFP